MPPTTQHSGNKEKKNTKQGVKTSEGRTNPKQKECQETFDCHLIRTASKTGAASKEKTFYFGQFALNGEYNRSKLKKKTYLLSSGAYHYSTETYSRIRNFGNNHTLKQ